MIYSHTTCSSRSLISHLQAELWAEVNAFHLRKVISEFAHEFLIKPELKYIEDGWGHYLLKADHPDIEYRFRARILSLDHWHVDLKSLQKTNRGKVVPIDVVAFIIEFRETIGINADLLPSYLEEVFNTLYGAAYRYAKQGESVQELVHADYQKIEHAMGGHPCFVANNGRIGFDASDYRAYAPEAADPFALLWIAVHQDRAVYAGTHDWSYEKLLEQELSSDTVESFHEILRERGLDPWEYYYMPVHPWQWMNKLTQLFASDIAYGRLVYLGKGSDEYMPQQSIRTFFNISAPYKHYVKTPLSIVNMGFVRGLSTYYMKTTPTINEWVAALVNEDEYLRQKGFIILREVATIGYRHPHYETAVEKTDPYNKMLAVLWRESPMRILRPGQRLMTMAALLHVDKEGNALLPALIRASGLDADVWIGKYLEAYLSPLLHCFYMHDLVFMPHGENLILVLENHVPVRAIMKDIAEEVGILSEDKNLPVAVERISISMPDEIKLAYFFTDIFDCIFRFIAPILFEHHDYPQGRFWKCVAGCVEEYQKTFPHLREKFRRYDLFAPEFMRCCLNRLQIKNNRQMVNLADPASSMQFVGMLQNPIAPFAPSEV